MKIIFMGTPDFGARILKKIHEQHEIVLVVTQPDKLVGRKQTLTMSPVKEQALLLQLPVFQPVNIRQEEDPILSTPCDLIVTAAYGQFIGNRVLSHPLYRSINVHASLLPKYRGGAPIQRALMNGETQTGITIMYMEKKMDSGAILAQEVIPILPEDNADSLFHKLSLLGVQMILPVIRAIEHHTLVPIPQQEDQATFAYNLTKADECINFQTSATSLCNQMRGLCNQPGAYFTLDGVIYKVYGAQVASFPHQDQPGTIIEVTNHTFTIACGEASALTFTHIKPEGRSFMTVEAFLNGKGKNIIIKNRRIQ